MILSLGLLVLVVAASSVQSAAFFEDRPYHDEPYHTVDLDGVNSTAELTSQFKWSKSVISYRIMNYPVRVLQSEIRAAVRHAFDAWSRVTNLDFVEDTRTIDVDIQLAFEGLNHQRRGQPCRYSYDSTLAHAFFPEHGDVHFNTKYFFTEDTSIEQFINTATHEIGHSLGLLHSTSRDSIMYFSQTSNLFAEPQPEDINAIQSLYGVRSSVPTTNRPPLTSTRPPPTRTPRPRTNTDLCTLTSYDAILTDHRGNICVLAGRFYYNLNETNPVPRKAIAKWPGLPAKVDAGFTYRDSKTYFYKGDQYWKYSGLRLEQGYPRPLSQAFPGIPPSVDAILLAKSGGFHAFKGPQYWYYDIGKQKPVEWYYPKAIDDGLGGFPKKLDAALVTGEGRRFVFAGLRYLEVGDDNKVIGRMRDVRKDLFNCA
ncbi:hypothetical protein pipiens_014133 [Culex pipiens pipiens]|uniref:Peptidase metallopeptidase domain-containing protein n=2 Tax=Culex pipiens TaxID=7175 RepID=A0ABD1CVQ9_CULPP